MCSGLACCVCISFKIPAWGMLFSNFSDPENGGSEKEQLVMPGRLRGRETASFGKEA